MKMVRAGIDQEVDVRRERYFPPIRGGSLEAVTRLGLAGEARVEVAERREIDVDLRLQLAIDAFRNVSACIWPMNPAPIKPILIIGKSCFLAGADRRVVPAAFTTPRATLEVSTNYVNRIVDNIGNRRIGLRMQLEGEAFLKEEEKS